MDVSEFLAAVSSNCIDDVRAALSSKPDLVNAHGWDIGTTALHCASHRGFTEMVRLLLDLGADVHALETASQTMPLHWAAEAGHPAIARLLVERGSELSLPDDW